MRCPTCGRDAARTVHYRRDRTWPESFSYCDSGHSWLIRAGALSLDEFLRHKQTPEQDAEDGRMYAESKRYLHRLMREAEGEE